MTEWANYIERNDFSRVVMIGAGAQAESFESEVNVSEGTMRFLRLLSERSTSIGVRGYFTERVLHRLGIENVRVIGCPTVFWSMDPNFHLGSAPGEPKRVAVNVTPHGFYRDKLELFLSEAWKIGAQYITQDEYFVADVGEKADERREFASWYFGGEFRDSKQLLEWIKREKHFYKIPEWIDYLRDYDFVCGTRFHGNMAAIQAGIPALNFVHDTRTKELCDFLNLPYINFSRYRGESIRQLAALADYELFNSTYPDRFRNYVDFLEENGLRHNLAKNGNGLISNAGNMVDCKADLTELESSSDYYMMKLRNQELKDYLSAGTLFPPRLGLERLEPLRPGNLARYADQGKLNSTELRRIVGSLNCLDSAIEGLCE